MNLPHRTARCTYCLTIPSLQRVVSGTVDLRCQICEADVTLFSAQYIHEHNPISWLHGKEMFNECQGRFGFALLETTSEPRCAYMLVAHKVSAFIHDEIQMGPGWPVLTSDSLFPHHRIA